MEKVKSAAEETILISFFAGFFLLAIYFAFQSKEIYLQIFGISAAMFCAKSALIRFYLCIGIINKPTAWFYSCQGTIFCLFLFAAAIAAKYLL